MMQAILFSFLKGGSIPSAISFCFDFSYAQTIRNVEWKDTLVATISLSKLILTNLLLSLDAIEMSYFSKHFLTPPPFFQFSSLLLVSVLSF